MAKAVRLGVEREEGSVSVWCSEVNDEEDGRMGGGRGLVPEVVGVAVEGEEVVVEV